MSTKGLEEHWKAVEACRELRARYLAERQELYKQVLSHVVRELTVEDAVIFLDEVPLDKLSVSATITLVSKIAEIAEKQEKLMFASLLDAVLE